MFLNFTHHAADRINGRLAGLVTAAEIDSAVNSTHLQPGENYIDVKYFDERIYLGDRQNPDTPKGDKITAKVILEAGRAILITVMLRKSTSKSERYNP